jgi:hypothetical protein
MLYVLFFSTTARLTLFNVIIRLFLAPKQHVKVIARSVIIIIIIIIGKDTISFMQDIYTYIPDTNHVPEEYNVAAILSPLFMVSILLAPALALMYFYISTFRRMSAVPNMADFCSSLTPWFPGMVLTYFLMILKWFQSLQLLLVSP